MILTAFSPVDHPRELLQALRSDDNTVHFHCSDGEFSSSVLLLAAVSPLIQEIGRQISSCDCEEFNLFLPDHSVTEIQQFMTFLTSYSGPCTSIERQTFAQLLRFFGQNSLAVQEEEVIRNEESVPEEQSTDSEVEEEDWNPDYQSSDFEEAEMAPSKGPSFKSKIFFQILLHRLCLIYYSYGSKMPLVFTHLKKKLIKTNLPLPC